LDLAEGRALLGAAAGAAAVRGGRRGRRALHVPAAGGVLRDRHLVFSEVVSLLISKTERLGGERGVGLPTARLVDPRWLEPLTFWISAAIAVASVAGTYALLRSRVGLGLMTVRDNDVAAASIGVDVWWNRFIAFVIAAAGCGLAGAVSFTATLYVAPGFAFDPNWV